MQSSDIQKTFKIRILGPILTVIILSLAQICMPHLASAATKNNLILTIENHELRYQSAEKVTKSDLSGICKDRNYRYPYGEKVTVINEKGVLLGQSIIMKWLQPKLIMQEEIDPEVEYEMELEGIRNSVKIGLLTQEEFDRQEASYLADKYAATISCSLQVSVPIYVSGNFLKIRIAGFNVSDFLETARIKKSNWKYSIKLD